MASNQQINSFSIFVLWELFNNIKTVWFEQSLPQHFLHQNLKQFESLLFLKQLSLLLMMKVVPSETWLGLLIYPFSSREVNFPPKEVAF